MTVDGAIWDDEKNYMEESQRRSVARNVVNTWCQMKDVVNTSVSGG